MKLRKYFIVLILGGLLLAACAPVSTAGPSAPAAGPAATVPPAPTSAPVNTQAAPATGTPVTAQPAAAVPSIQDLAKKLNISADQIKVASTEEIEWPNACLGAQGPDEMCAEVITPGYKVMLEAGGQAYEYHTNQDGSAFRLLNSPSPASLPTQTSQPAQAVPAAAQAAQNALAQQLGVSAQSIKIDQVEPVQWPDGCLGVQKPGIMCTQIVTAGYRVILDLNGQQFEYHTDQVGDTVILATPTMPQTANTTIVWEQTENGVCSRVEIGQNSAAFGTCGSTMQPAQLAEGRVQELAYLLSTYQSFSGGTKAGVVLFNGQGQQQPTEAEQRSVAEWAHLVYMEVSSGRSGAAWGLALSWHREGGIAGFCNDLGIYMTGWAVPSSCKPGSFQGYKEYRLTSAELEQMYSYVDQFTTFDYEQKDPASADAMTIRMELEGRGTGQAAADQQQQIATFAGQIYTEATR